MSYVKIKDRYRDIDTKYEGVELCCRCGLETGYYYNPVTDKSIRCEHCGCVQHPCSLCDSNNCNPQKCLTNIREELLRIANEE